jgi:nickel-dependent lactate racemase
MTNQAPALKPEALRAAVENPIGTPRLREIAAGKKTVAIAFDDLTRLTPTYDVVPYVGAELRASGVIRGSITTSGRTWPTSA